MNHPKAPAVPAYLNRLLQVDALDLARQLEPESIDMLLTDPPYSSGGLHVGDRVKDTTTKYIFAGTKTKYEDFASDNMDQRSWSWWCRTWLQAAHRALKPGGLVVCFIDWRQLPLLTDVIQAAGFTLQGIAVWDKMPGKVRPRAGGFSQQAEFIVWASKGKLPRPKVYLAGVFPSRLNAKKQHLTEKPIEVARQIVRLVPPGGTVADFFAGCGTFLLAAAEAGLNWTGSETNKTYYELASQRLADVPAQLAA